MRRIAPLLALLALAGCTRRAVPGRDAGRDLATPAALDLRRDRKDLLFTWSDSEGKLHDVASVEQVPEDRRRQVLVRDLSKPPEEVRSDQYVYVADLSHDLDGGWPYAVVSRYSMDRALREGDFAATDDAEDGGFRVVVYGTSWCGACAQARSWLKSKGIPFADKDVEADPKANAEMARKLKRAGIAFGGVPVLDVGGKILLGFDPGQVERLLPGT